MAKQRHTQAYFLPKKTGLDDDNEYTQAGFLVIDVIQADDEGPEVLLLQAAPSPTIPGPPQLFVRKRLQNDERGDWPDWNGEVPSEVRFSTLQSPETEILLATVLSVLGRI